MRDLGVGLRERRGPQEEGQTWWKMEMLSRFKMYVASTLVENGILRVGQSIRVMGRLNEGHEGHESQHPCSMELALRRRESKTTIYDFGRQDSCSFIPYWVPYWKEREDEVQG